MGKPTWHGFFHSYLFVLTIYPVVLSLIIYLAERKFDRILLDVYRFFRFYPREVKYSFKTVYLSCLIGGVSHIFFDMWVHKTSPYILFPLYNTNPFWTSEGEVFVYTLVVLLSLYSVYLWMRHIQNQKIRIRLNAQMQDADIKP
jgi:hypothetical protein